jgi:hypothetical protein
VQALRKERLGPSPTVLDQLLVRRVINGWRFTTWSWNWRLGRRVGRGTARTWKRRSTGHRSG